eukprot:jgi/Chrzof1/792/Cz01g29010.t1
MAGLSTNNMPVFVSLEEVEGLAKKKLPQMVYDYYAGGAETQQTVLENRIAFARYQLLPRILIDVSKLDTSTTLLGHRLAFPMLVAPMAMHGMAHPGKEIATARAAAAEGIPMVVSTMANCSIAEVASSGHPCLLFQLYVIKNKRLVAGMVRQAEALGYKALMITVDAQRLGKRDADERNRFHLPEGLVLSNLLPLVHHRVGDGQADTLQARDTDQGSGLLKLFADEVDDSLTWEFIPWLRTITKLPVFIKGVLSPEDAVIAVQYGVDGLVVSNHGGRQLDTSPSALDMLPAIVAAVGGRIPVLMDGGVRRGTDVLKAIALGATAVLLGRPILYGLAIGGEHGVRRVIQLLKQEFELSMALSGCCSVGSITSKLLLPAPGMPAVPHHSTACGTSGNAPQLMQPLMSKL